MILKLRPNSTVVPLSWAAVRTFVIITLCILIRVRNQRFVGFAIQETPTPKLGTSSVILQ